MSSTNLPRLMAALSVLCCLCGCSRSTPPAPALPPRSDSELIAQLDATLVGDREIVVMPVDLWVKDDRVTLVLAVGASTVDVAIEAAAEYAMYIRTDPGITVWVNGQHSPFRRVPTPDPGGPDVHYPPKSDYPRHAVRILSGIQSGRHWVIATPSVWSSQPMAPGRWPITLVPHELKAAPSAPEPWALRFAAETALELRASPD
jgi:hypothetical protein